MKAIIKEILILLTILISPIILLIGLIVDSIYFIYLKTRKIFKHDNN